MHKGLIVSGSADGTVRTWTISDAVHSMQGHTAEVVSRCQVSIHMSHHGSTVWI